MQSTQGEINSFSFVQFFTEISNVVKKALDVAANYCVFSSTLSFSCVLVQFSPQPSFYYFILGEVPQCSVSDYLYSETFHSASEDRFISFSYPKARGIIKRSQGNSSSSNKKKPLSKQDHTLNIILNATANAYCLSCYARIPLITMK